MSNAATYFRAMAHNNAWANHRLLGACAKLSDAAFKAERVSFFPSLMETLNHNLTVDWFYVDALEREARGEPPHPRPGDFFTVEEPCGNCAQLHEAQRAVDARLLAYCAALTDDSLARSIRIQRPAGSTPVRS